jgi:tRNA (guanosine-2'-O-)-methyltransferase
MPTFEENTFVLEQFYDIITPNKIEMFDRIASERTRYLTLALEDVFQEHNASAVIRTCDCFGIQDLHAIEKKHKYVLQRKIALGAGRWIDLFRYLDRGESTQDCIDSLKSKGYALVATSPHLDAYTHHNLPLDKPVALFFGTEHHGLSETVMENADYHMKIPMYGFTESFNLSVSVALVVQTLRQRLTLSDIQWKLSESEQVQLKIDWCAEILNGGKSLENSYRKAFLEKEF